MIHLYTDGAAKGNPGPGGYAAILTYRGRKKCLTGAFAMTTNNRMELLAVIKGLEALKSPPAQQVAVYTDSRYVVYAITKGWLAKWIAIDFKKKKNRDLWLRFNQLYKRHRVTFHWVKGHAGHPLNEACDQLAVAAANHGPWEIDQVYEKMMAT